MTEAIRADATTRILEAAEADALIVLVGAGASAAPPLDLPSWGGFLGMCAQRLDTVQPARAALIRDEIRANRYLEAGSVFARSTLTAKQREDFFRHVFDPHPCQPPPVYGQLARLPVRHWLTTNFDPALKVAVDSRDADARVEVVDWTDLSSVISLWNEVGHVVYLHGRAHRPERLVYCSESFSRLRTDTYRHFMRRVFTENSVFMYGYSCRDPDLVETLDFVRDELGGAGRFSHYLLTSDPGAHDSSLLSAANVSLIPYDPADGHAEAFEFVRGLNRAAGHRSRPSRPAPFISSDTAAEFEGLLDVYVSLGNAGRRHDTLRVRSALVTRILREAGGECSRDNLLAQTAKLVRCNQEQAASFAADGLGYLERVGHLEKVPDGSIRLASVAMASQSATGLGELVDAVAIRVRTNNANFRLTPSAAGRIRRAIAYAMIAQGMNLARAFSGHDAPSAYSLEMMVREGLENSGGYREDMHRALTQVLAEPTPDQSRTLFDLAHAAYDLERVFLNPATVDLGQSLRWSVYLDSNVVLRLLAPSSPQHRVFKELFERLQRLRTPLCILYPFIEEIAQHADSVNQTLRSVRTVADLQALLATMDRRSLSPLLLEYAADIERTSTSQSDGLPPFADFTRTRDLDSPANVSARLSRMGVVVEGRDAIRRLDTSRRETLWHEIRAYHGQVGGQSQPQRRLRRNEATQVVWLEGLRAAGRHCWFLSLDGRLRQVLKHFERGVYADYVTTPTAWAMRLADLGWGDLDVAGFSELMWSAPATAESARRRLADLALRDVLQSEDLRDFEPERLRDLVDSHFRDIDLAGVEALPTDERDDALNKLGLTIVPEAVERILDDIARARQAHDRGAG